MKSFNEALDNYDRSLNFAVQTPFGRGLVEQIKNSIEEVQRKSDSSQEVHSRRQFMRSLNSTMKYFRDPQHIQSIYDAKLERFSFQKPKFDNVDSSGVAQRSIKNNEIHKKLNYAF